MANTNSQIPSVQFSVKWRINWSEFAKLSPSSDIGKCFFTSYNNVPMLWRTALMVQSSDSPDIAFALFYLDGPIDKVTNTECEVSIMKPDLSIVDTRRCPSYEAERFSGYAFEKYFDDRDPVAIRATYELKEPDPLLIRITLKIPISVFSYAPDASPWAAPQKWTADLFASIQDPDKLVFSNAKLISRDGDEFYCDKVIGYQSEALQAIFRHPLPPGKNEYEFPHLGSTSLKTLLQFLYTGQVELGNLTTTSLIELADAAEMYYLKSLKQACAIVLWKEVVDNPNSCAAILRFAYLHDDLMDLKGRAMDVLAQNYETLSADEDIFDNNDLDKENRDNLRKEFLLFQSCRVEPNSAG